MRTGLCFGTSRFIRLLGFFVVLLLPAKGIAQNAPGYAADSKTANGLQVTNFKTPQGKIKVYMTDDLAVGKTISGTVEATPEGKTDKERKKNQSALDEYVIEWAGQKINVGAKKFTSYLPETINAATKNLRLSSKGNAVAETELPVSPAAPPLPEEFSLPTGGMKGTYLQVRGPGDGMISPEDYVKIGETTLPVIAKSMYKQIVLNTHEKPGPTEIHCREDKKEATCSFRNIDLDLTAAKLNLRRGETTTLHLVVKGLEGLKENEELDLVNSTTSIVAMSGGEAQHILIPHEEISNEGNFAVTRTLTGITPGTFAITGNIEWTGVCNLIYAMGGLIELPQEGLTQVTERPEILTGLCHDANDKEEPGQETVIVVDLDGTFTKILNPKNVGTCPLEIYCVDANGKKIPGTSVYLEPGQVIEKYTPPVVEIPGPPPFPPPPLPPLLPGEKKWAVARVVFQCDSPIEGACQLQMDHSDQDYVIPRDTLRGKCDNKPVKIGPADEGTLYWIKNSGTCPVEIYSLKNKIPLAKPTVIAPGVMLPVYNPRSRDDSIYFRCPESKNGKCEIVLDSTNSHKFPLPKDKKIHTSSSFKVLKGECDEEENTICITNRREIMLKGLKNLGTCPIEIFEWDDKGKKRFGMEVKEDESGGHELKQRDTPFRLEPGEESSVDYISDKLSNKIVMRCLKDNMGNSCRLRIFDRDINYLGGDDPTPGLMLKPLRTAIHGNCGQPKEQKTLLTMLNGDVSRIKWITNAGGCTVEIFSIGMHGGVIKSSAYELEPGETIEGYYPPLGTKGVYFRCIGGSIDARGCIVEFERAMK